MGSVSISVSCTNIGLAIQCAAVHIYNYNVFFIVLNARIVWVPDSPRMKRGDTYDAQRDSIKSSIVAMSSSQSENSLLWLKSFLRSGSLHSSDAGV